MDQGERESVCVRERGKKRKKKGEYRYLVRDNGLDVLFCCYVHSKKTANYLLCTEYSLYLSLDQSCRIGF